MLCCALIFLSACSGAAEKTGSEKNGETLIAASFYPVYIFTLNLLDGIDTVRLECMAEQNVGCLHDYQLLAKDAKLLSDSSVLVINGAGMEAFIEDAYKNNGRLSVIDSSEGIELLSDEHGEHDEHEEHGEHSEHEVHAFSHEHSHDANSHIWMSVSNAEKQVENIAAGLCSELPQFADKINENKTAYLARLSLLEKELADGAAALEGKPIITFHEAYDYMAEELSLTIADSIESDDGGEPSAKELAILTGRIRELGVKALFTEPNYKGAAAEILSRETGAGVFVLDPVTGGEKNIYAYENIMRSNLDILIKAVG